MHDAVLELVQLLVQAGAIPGTDFSCDPERQAFWMNNRSYTLLRDSYPEVDWDEIFVGAQCAPPAITALHEQLGVPFADRLADRIVQQFQTLPHDQVAWYLQQVFSGVERRTGIALYPLLANRLNLTELARLEWLLREEVAIAPCQTWIEDVILAAGGHPDDVEWQDGEIYLTEQGMKLLETVWMGEEEIEVALANEG